jgi:aminoglycoside phosphotransferase family enzyme/predicted kinase
MLAIAELLRPSAFPHPAPDPVAEETHISWVVLAGEFAYKIKKPVRLPFLDYSSLAARKHFCEEEVRLNRRLAPELYLGVSTIVRTSGGLAIDQEGPIVEYAVRMRRFSSADRLDRRLAEGRLIGPDIDRCAIRVADMHRAAPRADPGNAMQAAAAALDPVTACLDALGHRSPAVQDARRWLADREPVLTAVFENRHRSGWVRECHGDLHLANLADLDGCIVPFDAIEFDSALRWTDIQADAAFLLMDLQSRHRRDLGWRFYDGWLARTGDYEGVAALRFYLIYRHLVRAKVDRIRLSQALEDSTERRRIESRLAVHLGSIRDLVRPGRPALILTHGLSASGKSTVARNLAAEMPMVRLPADLVRKRMAGLDPFDTSAPPPAGLYDHEFTEQVYGELRRLADLALDAGWNTIVDATFLTAERRRPLMELAVERGLPVLCLHCRAPEAELRRRIVARRRAGTDPSDADLAVLEDQMAKIEGPAADERDLWLDLDTARLPPAEELAAGLRSRLWA